MAYPWATLCLFPGYLWPVSVLVPYLFSGLVPGFSLAILCLLPGLALGCVLSCTLYTWGSAPWPVLYLGAVLAVVVPCPLVSMSRGSVCYLLVLTFCVPWFRVYHLASQPLGCVLGCRLGLLCPCVKVALATPWAVPQSLLPHRGGPEALLHSTVFHLVIDL